MEHAKKTWNLRSEPFRRKTVYDAVQFPPRLCFRGLFLGTALRSRGLKAENCEKHRLLDMDDAVSRQWRRDKPVPRNIAVNSTGKPSSRTTIFVIVPTNVPSNTHRNLARRFIDSSQPQWFQFTGFWSIGFWLRNREKNSGTGCWICKLLVSFPSVLVNCFFLFFIEHSKRCARYISAVWIFAIFKDRAGKIW